MTQELYFYVYGINTPIYQKMRWADDFFFFIFLWWLIFLREKHIKMTWTGIFPWLPRLKFFNGRLGIHTVDIENRAFRFHQHLVPTRWLKVRPHDLICPQQKRKCWKRVGPSVFEISEGFHWLHPEHIVQNESHELQLERSKFYPRIECHHINVNGNWYVGLLRYHTISWHDPNSYRFHGLL